jgi:Na+-driven multidrug efflux pump
MTSYLFTRNMFFLVPFSEQDSPMRIPAQRFLSLRALGAPAVVVSLALQGVFRGFKDTKTPVFCLGKCLGLISVVTLLLTMISSYVD